MTQVSTAGPRENRRSALFARLLPTLAVAALVLAPSAGRGDERRIVALQPPAPTRPLPQKGLLREIVRQAFLITARDDFGLATRDAWLREPLQTPGAEVQTFEITPVVESSGQVNVTTRLQNRAGAPWTDTIPPTSPAMLDGVLARSVEWSRSRFPDLLKEAGYAPTPQAPAAADDKPFELADEPVPLDFVSLLGSLRKVHAALRTQPDSAPLLARAAREYALLGSLCEVHWGAEHKIFKARALLYAERAVQKGPDEAAAAWSRALVRALCGLDAQAVQDVDRARGLKGADAPPWSPAVDAYARWDAATLQKEIENKTPLAAYLGMRQGEIAGSDEERRQAAHRCFEESPECLRAVASLAEEGAIGLRRSLGAAQLRQFLRVFPQQLASVSGLPPETEKALADAVEPENLPQAIAQHVALVKTLRSEAARQDREEPSLAVLATLVENLNFVHAVQIASTERKWLGVDPGETILELEPLLEPHPARRFLRVFQQDSFQAQAAYNEIAPALTEIPLSEAAEQHISWLAWLRSRDNPRQLDSFRTQRDEVLPDLLLKLQEPLPPGGVVRLSRLLREISPDCPAVIATLIRCDWPGSAPQAAAWEERYPAAIVLKALASAYREHAADNPMHLAAAERCLKTLAERFPSVQAQLDLASLYKERGDDEAWKAALDRALELPSYGLEHASIADRIADWYMDQKKWTDALPYALRAADSYSSYGLLSAARCYEGLENWEQAEQYRQANTQRYDGAWEDWYFWCQRTGHGDSDAAAAYAQQHLAGLTDQQRNQIQEIAVFYQLQGEQEKALEHHLRFKDSENEGVYSTMSAILLTDELGRTEERDRLIARILAPGDETMASLLCEHLLRPAPSGDAPPAFSEPEMQLCHVWEFDNGQMTNAAWFIGKLLLNRNRRDEALPWLKRAAASPATNKWTCVLASAELTRLGVELPSRRDSEVDDEMAPVLALQKEAVSHWKPQEIAQALEAIRKAVELKPDWSPIWLTAARLSADAGNVSEAIDRYGEFLKRVPGNPTGLVGRGKLYEISGRLPEAIRDYEAALTTAPRFPQAHNNLAWVRAASADAQFRDGRKALEHVRLAYAFGPDRNGISDVVLAAAHAEAGEFDKAVKLITAAISKGKYPDKARLERWLDSYKQKKPYRRDPVMAPAK
ncbi:hypothetical protein [Planctomyces sp. SH-PL14]|uniref:hypothetical protein n=1 Tax=Planctomyces sp. SH-PL14 TaxID=1632864 RepID=UPI00078CAE8E|nr:hypothetical protein [Planctomyces sp. SH-PL14]AMV19946.1 Tetratricopeptide repeat protein [Planctomyces sp. SH-PL14]